MTRPRVLVTRAILEAPLRRLREVADVCIASSEEPLSAEELRRKADGVDAILCHLTDRVDGALLEAAGPQLKIIANYAVGYNNIDLAACRKAGVWVSNTPGVLSEATADIAFTLMMAIGRRVVEGDRLVRTGEWTGWAPKQLLGGDFHGRTLGILGCGRIGQAMARRASGFGMRLMYHQPRPLDPEVEESLGLNFVSFDVLLRKTDFLSLHCPLTEETRHLIGTEELKAMKPTAYLINTSRGPVIDEAALVQALQEKEIAGAGLDVFEEEPRLTPGLAELDNVVLLPHLGSATQETRTRMGDLAVANILAALDEKTPPNELTGN